MTVDERAIDEGLVKIARGFGALSGVLAGWATGRLSTYLKMLLLGLAVFLGALAASRFFG